MLAFVLPSIANICTNRRAIIMNTVRGLFAVLAIAFAGSAWAYQVTGPVIELTDTKIVVQKGKEKWEIARTPGTKVSGNLKVGSQVTIEYSMTAKTVDVKPEKSEKGKK